MRNIFDTKGILTENRTREKWIDALRGIAMLLVLLGHMIPGRYIYFVLTSPIKIPLFFVISGYVFSDRRRSCISYFKKMIRTIFIPYFFLSLLPIKLVYALANGSMNSFFRYIKEFVSGEAYWYMPCYIFVSIFTFFITRFSSGIAKYTAFCIVAGIGYILSQYQVNNFGYYVTAMICISFVMIGQLFKDLKITRMRIKYRIISGLVAIFIYLFFCVISFYKYPGQVIDVHTNRFYNLFVCGNMIASGCYALFVLADKIRLPRGIIYVGRNTLYYYLLSPYIMMLLRMIYQYVDLDSENIFISLMSFVFTCIVCTAAAFICNRYLPFLSRKTNTVRDKSVQNN